MRNWAIAGMGCAFIAKIWSEYFGISLSLEQREVASIILISFIPGYFPPVINSFSSLHLYPYLYPYLYLYPYIYIYLYLYLYPSGDRCSWAFYALFLFFPLLKLKSRILANIY